MAEFDSQNTVLRTLQMHAEVSDASAEGQYFIQQSQPTTYLTAVMLQQKIRADR